MNKNVILVRLSESDKTKFGKVAFLDQSIPQKVFSAIWDVESQVNNGGLFQYFSTSSAESAPFVVEALKTIDAPKTAAILARAIAVAFPNGLPATEDDIRSEADSLTDEVLERLDALDNEFLAYPHNLTNLLFAYVSKHPEEFGTMPTTDEDAGL